MDRKVIKTDYKPLLCGDCPHFRRDKNARVTAVYNGFCSFLMSKTRRSDFCHHESEQVKHRTAKAVYYDMDTRYHDKRGEAV